MLLAALPATPVQLAHACYQLGFDIAVPASWGDELVAHAVLADLQPRDRDPVIQCTCPLVAERLLASGQHLVPSMVQTASPPVAAARYVRHSFAPHVRITYIGACPGARDSAIDQRYLPDEFLRLLDEHDVAVTDMPTVFDSVLPPDRRRYVSLPGGCPTQEALWQATDGRMLREVTQPTFSTDLAQTLVWREHVMIDVAPSLGCACAGGFSRLGAHYGRVAVMAVEPPRAQQPVVAFQPEFAAPTVERPEVIESRNGDTSRAASTAQGVADSVSAAPPSAPSEHRPGRSAEPPARVRARTRSTVALPRAYLAKRRHVTPASREAVLTTAPSSRPREAEAVVTGAEEVFPAPNDLSEVARPIAIHVEPEPGRPETPPQADRVAEPEDHRFAPVDHSVANATEAFAAAAPPLETAAAQEASIAARIEEGPPSRAVTSDATEALPEQAAEWEPPADVAIEEPPAPFEPPGEPLRVEVEIFEDVEATPPPDAGIPDAVIPDAVRREDSLKPPRPVFELVTRPVRPWGDLLIAVWLLLVASAVIASLLWRR